MERIIERLGEIRELEYLNGTMIILFNDGSTWRVKCNKNTFDNVENKRSDFMSKSFTVDDENRLFDFVYDDFLDMRNRKVHPLIVCKKLDLNKAVFCELVEYTATKFGAFENSELEFIADKMDALGRSEIAFMLGRTTHDVTAKIKAISKKNNYTKKCV